MEHDLQTWDLAKVMLEQYGIQAMHGARAVTATIQGQDALAEGTDCHEIVRVMDFLLSDDMDQTVH
jgi:hypothetical protein